MSRYAFYISVHIFFNDGGEDCRRMTDAIAEHGLDKSQSPVVTEDIN